MTCVFFTEDNRRRSRHLTPRPPDICEGFGTIHNRQPGRRQQAHRADTSLPRGGPAYHDSSSAPHGVLTARLPWESRRQQSIMLLDRVQRCVVSHRRSTGILSFVASREFKTLGIVNETGTGAGLGGCQG